MARSGTLITWVFSYSAESQQEHLYSCRRDSGVLSSKASKSNFFFLISESFSSVMQYSQKEDHRFVPIQRRSLTLPTKGFSVWRKKTSFYLCGTFLVDFFFFFGDELFTWWQLKAIAHVLLLFCRGGSESLLNFSDSGSDLDQSWKRKFKQTGIYCCPEKIPEATQAVWGYLKIWLCPNIEHEILIFIYDFVVL